MDITLSQAWADYWVDSLQRTVLTWDVLRRRGNQYLEHHVKGLPPVLVFDYDTVLDGRSLERPVNYQLLRVRPAPDQPTDMSKRPIVVVDPRAGHGPGIGGFKPDSQIGLALSHGYPCYFVSFLPHPVPGQNIEDVARAEAEFLKKVAELHPEAEDRPVVIGNCQAGWAVAMLSAAAPELMSVVILNGAPLSYWSGEVGNNPMRYLGGLVGGTWPAAFAADLGDGLFDGASLVSNFENLDPANTYWKKPYNLYANVDDEGDRFLAFERWWGGHFLLTKDEIRFITEELFVGNKLALGGIHGSSGKAVDLRNVKAPIVVFASKGDNITPPQQALNWILDVYDSTDDIRAAGQVIIYMLHESIGHLGIFVSTKVAKREHRAMMDNLDVISSLPPGLYEMTITGSREIAFQKRELEDIRRLDDTRREELFFLPVARVSEMGNAVYDSWLSPLVRAFSNPLVGELTRRMVPSRLERWLWSDVNPVMALVAESAQRIRADRRPAGEDNEFRAWERAFGAMLVDGLDRYRDMRDHMCEWAFYGCYLPLRAAMRGEEEALLAQRRNRLGARSYQARQWIDENLVPRMAEGGVAEAALRVMLWLARGRPAMDPERFRLAEKVLLGAPSFAALSSRQMRDRIREQFQLLMVDAEQAIASLPSMVESDEDRRAVLDLVQKAMKDVGGMSKQQEQDMDRIRELLEEGAAPVRAGRAARRQRQEPGDRPLH